MIMDKFELQQLRDLPIEEVAERLGMEVRGHKALCPFHDDHHASLSFHIRRNTFRSNRLMPHAMSDSLSAPISRLPPESSSSTSAGSTPVSSAGADSPPGTTAMA